MQDKLSINKIFKNFDAAKIGTDFNPAHLGPNKASHIHIFAEKLVPNEMFYDIFLNMR